MAFTYVGSLGTDLDRVRFYLQDTVSGTGPKPADGNFSDAELNGLITVEGSWQRAVAGGFETLANAWRKFPSFTADGLKLDRSDIADGYVKQAAEWRKKFGYAPVAAGTSTSTSSAYGPAGSRATTRVDGYSSDVTNQET